MKKVILSLDQNKLAPYPKKDKKILFTDPFLIDVAVYWLKIEHRISKEFVIADSMKAEIAVLSSFVNKNPIFYIKAEGEVDFAVITNGKFLPIEVKWTRLVKKDDVKQILKYSNGYILYRGFEDGVIGDISIRNIGRFLLEEKI